jgi:predicted RNA methylase
MNNFTGMLLTEDYTGDSTETTFATESSSTSDDFAKAVVNAIWSFYPLEKALTSVIDLGCGTGTSSHCSHGS